MCSGQNLSNSLCQFWNDKPIPLQILHPTSVSGKITLLYFFSSNNIYFAQKEPIKMKIFETFKCSGQNLSNSSCQLWNYKSVPLQPLRNYSLSWQIIPLWILTLFRMDFIGAAHGWGGVGLFGTPCLKSPTHILQW